MKNNGVFAQMLSKKIKPIKTSIPNIKQALEALIPCDHIFKKTEPSELNEHGVLLWQCVRCGYKKAST